MNDYPSMIAAVNHVEPVPRRVRAYLGQQPILDTIQALYVWEWPNYPQYYIPQADVHREYLVDQMTTQQTRRGKARVFGLSAGQEQRHDAARLLDESPVDGLVGKLRFEWAALDAWFEEDEQVFVHPRNPYVRVDALRSTRSVRVELDGVLLAESRSPVLVFETGLPTRYYLNRTEVRFENLTASDTVTQCPYKGTTTGVLVSTRRRHRVPRSRLVLQFPDQGPHPDSRPHCLLQREGRHQPRRQPHGTAQDALFRLAFRCRRIPQITRVRAA